MTDDSNQPEWWRRARALEAQGKFEEAERAITDAVDHIGAYASVAELHAQRMRRLMAAGDEAGAMEARTRAADWIRAYAGLATSGGEGAALSLERDEFLAEIGVPLAQDAAPGPTTPFERFAESMRRNHERWHDGIGYDLQALAEAGPDQRRMIEERLLDKHPLIWHDIEALAALDTPRARARILAALDDPDAMVRAAVTRFASGQVAREDHTAALVKGLETAAFYGGLTQVLDQVAEFHPPAVVDALCRGALRREGEVAVHYAAMLMFVLGKAKEAFDWDHRPFYLRFHTEDRSAREAAFRELCGRVGIDPGRFLT